MSLSVDVYAQSRRKERVFKLLTKITKDGIVVKERALAEFSFETGASEERVASYLRILVNSGRVEERAEDGKIWVGTPTQFEAEETARMRKRNEVLHP